MEYSYNIKMYVQLYMNNYASLVKCPFFKLDNTDYITKYLKITFSRQFGILK